MSKKPYKPVEIEVTKLEDCPHCGGKAEIKAFSGKFYHGWVGCPACGIYKQWTVSPVEAVKIWNRQWRPAEPVYDAYSGRCAE